ncbi:MAG: hypothetical protein AB7P02_29525 [Alphaproteobacteria bacterium]
MLDDGRLFGAIAALAVLFFLVQQVLPAGSPWIGRLRLGALAALVLGMVAALVAGLLAVGGRP